MASGSRSQRLSLEEVLLKIHENDIDEVEVRQISDNEEHEFNHELELNYSDDLH